MKIDIKETLRNPGKTLDAMIAFGMSHARASFDGVELTAEEWGFVNAKNTEAANNNREGFRIELRDLLRLAGYDLADDWGKEGRRHLHLATDQIGPEAG